MQEEIQTSTVTIDKDLRGWVMARSIEQTKDIEMSMSAILSTMLTLEADEDDDPKKLDHLKDLRVQVAIICRDALGRDHPDCAKLP